jgi:hypothetical protein
MALRPIAEALRANGYRISHERVAGVLTAASEVSGDTRFQSACRRMRSRAGRATVQPDMELEDRGPNASRLDH